MSAWIHESVPGTCYAIEQRGAGVRIVRGERRGRRVQIEPLPPGDTEQQLDRIHAEVAAGQAQTVVAVPGHQTILRALTSPLGSIAKTRKILPSMLDIKLPFPVEDCLTHWADLHRNEKGKISVLAVAMRRESMASAMDAWGVIGVNPLRMDAAPLAIWAGVSESFSPDDDEDRIVVWMGEQETEWMIGRGGHLAQTLSVRSGQEEAESDLATAATRTAARVLSFLRSGLGGRDAGAATWIWCGPAADIDAWRAALTDALNLPSGLGKVLPDADDVLARGMCVRSLLSDRDGCNLREGEFLHPVLAFRRAKRARRAAWSVLLAAGLILAVHAGWRGWRAHEVRAQEQQIASLAAELAGGARVPRGQELVVVDRILAEQRSSRAAFEDMARVSATRALQDLLAAANEHDLQLDVVALRPASALIQGMAATWAQPQALADALTSAGYDSPALDREDLGADQGIRFAVRVQP